MKILMLFLDQVRPSSIKDTPFEEWINNFGGTRYINCHTPSPNTTRSLAALFSGHPPKINGCDRPIKLAKHFMKPEIDDIFSIFKKNNYKVDVFHSPNEIEAGLFPSSVDGTRALHGDIYKFRDSLEMADKHLVWVGTNIHHFWMNRYNYNRAFIPDVLNKTKNFLENFFKLFDRDEFDHIFMFSDHGFLFSDEERSLKTYLSSRRTNVLMVHRKRTDIKLNIQDKFCSIMGLHSSLRSLVGKNHAFERPLEHDDSIEFLTLEDPVSYQPVVNNVNSMWGVRLDKDFIYITSQSGQSEIDIGTLPAEKRLTELECVELLKKFTDFQQENHLTEKEERMEELAVARYSTMSAQARHIYHRLSDEQDKWWC